MPLLLQVSGFDLVILPQLPGSYKGLTRGIFDALLGTGSGNPIRIFFRVGVIVPNDVLIDGVIAHNSQVGEGFLVEAGLCLPMRNFRGIGGRLVFDIGLAVNFSTRGKRPQE